MIHTPPLHTNFMSSHAIAMQPIIVDSQGMSTCTAAQLLAPLLRLVSSQSVMCARGVLQGERTEFPALYLIKRVWSQARVWATLLLSLWLWLHITCAKPRARRCSSYRITSIHHRRDSLPHTVWMEDPLDFIFELLTNDVTLFENQ
jgi:hypothetical protein